MTEAPMSRNALAKIVATVVFFPLLVVAEESGPPVVIDPGIQSYGGLFSQKLIKKFLIGDVVDKRKNAGFDTVGATRTGRFVTSALLCRPLPGELVKDALQGALREVGALATDKNGADFQIDVDLLDYTLEETNKVFSQQIKATVKFRVRVRAAESGSLVNQFVIRAEDARSAVDTTPFAVKVAKNALVSALQNLLDSLITIQ